MAYLLSIDQGTTSSRALLLDTASGEVQLAQREFPQHFPQNGWVEHDPGDIWHSVRDSVHQVLAKTGVRATEVTAIGITNQRETTLVWDRQTGEPVHRAIVWQDRRTADFCQWLQDAGHEALLQERSGLIADPYFSASKIRWLLDNVPGARDRAEQGHLAFGTVDSFLLWKLTGGRVHKTDATNACRTALFNIHRQQWDEELLSLFGVPAAMLPEVCDCATEFGVTDPTLFGAGIPVRAMIGDQQSALVGQACFEEGMAKSTYGTGCFFVLNTGTRAPRSEHRLLTTVAYRLNGETTYALEGSIFVAGAAIQWLRDGLHVIREAGESEALARETPSDHGVFMVPAFTGLGAPYWDPNARGAIFGLNRNSGIREIVTAALEAVCYQTRDLQSAMEKDGLRLGTLRVDGGMTTNRWLLQFLADILGVPVDCPAVGETTAQGAAYLAGLQSGHYDSPAQIAQGWQLAERFEPRWSESRRERLYAAWLDAVARVRSRES